MKNFVKKAGKIVVIAVFFLSVLNSIGIEDGAISFGNEDSQHSILALGGKAIGPVFEPMGISRKNWPASVALFTGLFAKEAIVGTLNSLYASMNMSPSAEIVEQEESAGLDVAGSITEAFTTIGEGVVGLITSFDILGIGLITEDQEALSEEIGADTSVYKHIATQFTVFSAFAYLLFVLMYFPCLAVIGAARQEKGGFYAGVMAVYSTFSAWAVATLFYQVAEGHNILFIILSLLIFAGIYGGLYMLGKREKISNNNMFAIPIRKSCCE